MKYLFIIPLLIILSGCGTLMKAAGESAYHLANAKETYCAETDPNAREILRQEYNLEMDKRGLPHDQINC